MLRYNNNNIETVEFIWKMVGAKLCWSDVCLFKVGDKIDPNSFDSVEMVTERIRNIVSFHTHEAGRKNISVQDHMAIEFN